MGLRSGGIFTPVPIAGIGTIQYTTLTVTTPSTAVGIATQRTESLAEPGSPIAIVHGLFRAPLNLVDSAGLTETERSGGTEGDEYLAIDTKSFYVAARPLEDESDFCLYQLIADSEAIGYYVGDELFEYEGIYQLETYAGKFDQTVPDFLADFESISQLADTGTTTTIQLTLDQAYELAAYVRSSRAISDELLALITPDDPDEPSYGVELGSPAYRGSMTLGLYIDVSPWGSEPRLEIVGGTGPGLRGFTGGQFNNDGNLVERTYIGFDDDYVEDPSLWISPPEDYVVSNYEFGGGPTVDPRNSGRYAYMFNNWLDAPQKIFKFDVYSRRLVNVLEVNSFPPGHAEWDNLYLEGPSGRYYWRYGSEGWHILEDTGYAVGTVYGENTSPFRDSIVVISLDTGEIIAESIYTFPGEAGGFTDNSSTPKGISWTKTADTTYRFMYVAGLGEDKIVIADWTVGDDEISLVQTTFISNTQQENVSPDHDDPGSFWFRNNTGTDVAKYDFSSNSWSTVLPSSATPVTQNNDINTVTYRKPEGATTGFIILWGRNFSGKVQSYRTSDYALVDEVTTTVPDRVNSSSMDEVNNFFTDVDNNNIVCIYGWNFSTSISKMAVITVAADGTLSIEEQDFPSTWDPDGKAPPWYPFFDYKTRTLYVSPRSDEPPWQIGSGGGDCLVTPVTLGYILNLIARRHRIPESQLDLSSIDIPVWGCQFLQGNLPSLQELIRRVLVAARFQIKDWQDEIEAMPLPNSLVFYIPDRELDKSDIVLVNNQPPVKVTIQDYEELSSGVQIRFLDADLNVTPNTIEFKYPWAIDDSLQVFDLTWLTLDKWDARRLCYLLAQDILAARYTYEFYLSPSNQRMEPGDLLQFPLDDTTTIIALVDRSVKMPSGLQKVTLRGVVSDSSIELTVESNTASVANPFATSTAQYIHLDLPLMSVASDLDGTLLLHYGFSTSNNDLVLPVTRLDRSFDDDLYTRLENRYEWPPTAILMNAPTRLDYRSGIDRTATLRCQALAGNWSTVTKTLTDESNALGTNALAVGAPGRWEIIYFGSMVGDAADSDVDMVLGDLISGQMGTSEQTNTQSIGDFVVFVADISLLGEQNIDTSYLDAAVYYKATPGYINPIAIDPVERTITGRAEQQPPLYDFTAVIDTTGDMLLEAQEQTRYPADEWLQTAATDPLAGDYVLEIYDGATLLRTIDSLAIPSYTYDAADQATDFGAALNPGDSIKVAWQRQTLLDGTDLLDGQKRTETIVAE